MHVFSWSPAPCDPAQPPPFVVPQRLASLAVRPGIAQVRPEELQQAMAPLLQFAEETLADRRADWRRFPLHLFATAGLRRQKPEDRDRLLGALRQLLARWPFLFHDRNVRILSGEEEGAYGWLSLNAELGVLGSSRDDSVGVLDLGGASFQITFVPQAGNSLLMHLFPLLMRGRQLPLYSVSYLQFGVREAHRLLQRKIIARTLLAEKASELEHPCFVRGTTFAEELISRGGQEASPDAAPLRAVWHGRGDFEECRAQISELFDKTAACYVPPCTFAGMYQPRLGTRKFVAFSTFSWVIEALALPYSGTMLEDIEHAARYVCKMTWSTLRERWRDLEEETMRTLCFSATYIVVLLETGLGFERRSHQIQFWESGQSNSTDISWANGAIMWAVNSWFTPEQPLCTASDATCAAAAPR